MWHHIHKLKEWINKTYPVLSGYIVWGHRTWNLTRNCSSNELLAPFNVWSCGAIRTEYITSYLAEDSYFINNYWTFRFCINRLIQMILQTMVLQIRNEQHICMTTLCPLMCRFPSPFPCFLDSNIQKGKTIVSTSCKRKILKMHFKPCFQNSSLEVSLKHILPNRHYSKPMLEVSRKPSHL